MAISKLPNNTASYPMDLANVPPCRLTDDRSGATQIAEHMITMLETYGSGEPRSLKIPSPVMLAGFYNRSVLDVLDALYELKMMHYEYITGGLDYEVILKDPLNRHIGNVHKVRKHPACVSTPWGCLIRHAGNDDKPIYPLPARDN